MLVLALPLLALAPTLIATLVLQRAQVGQRSDRIELRAATDRTDQALELLVDAETGARGYAASGDADLLEPFVRANDQLEATLDALVGTRAGAEADRIEAAIERALAEHARLVAAVDADAPAPELGELLRDGKAATDDARAVVSAVEADLTEQFSSSQGEAEDLERVISGLLVVGLAAGLGLAALGLRLFTRGIAGRVEAVTQNAVRLGEEAPMVPLATSADEVGRLSAALDDTARLLDERSAQILHSRNRAVAATRAKDEFLSRMSHELRTPLTAVLGFGQLLQLEDLSEDNRESVDHIVRAGRHLLDLINEVLDIARIETGDLSLSVEPIELRDLASETIALLGPYAAEHEVVVELAPMDEQLRASADRQRLKQVLLNLLSNAIKYNRVGGSVTVSAEHVGEVTRLQVRDTGLGISEDGRARIFVPFDRLDAAHGPVEGTGVGLSLSKGLVEAMGGTMDFTSEVGVGSTFWVDLPTPAPTKPASTPTPAEPSGTDRDPSRPSDRLGRSDTTVLYVEDNLANVRVMERVFERRNEALEVAMQGSRCLDLAQRLRPSLILLDLHLPDLDGEEVLVRLRAHPETAATKVVILSADISPRRVQRLLDLGANGYLSKPLDLAALEAVLDET